MTLTAGPPKERLLTLPFVIVVVAGFAYFLSLGMLLPVVPLFVKNRLGGDSHMIGIAVGAFSVGAILLRPYAGRLGDRFGRRLLIVGGAMVLAVAGFGYLVADDLASLIGIRILGGVGEAAFFVGAATMITDLTPDNRRGEAMSYWSVAIYGGLALGPALGEALLGAGVAEGGGEFDRVWMASALLAVAAALVGLATKETLVRREPTGAGAGGPDQARTRTPFLHRAALAPGTVLFLGLVGLAGFTEFVPLYSRELGMPDSKSVFLLYGGLVLALRIFGARLPDRLGPLRGASLATAGIAAGLAVMAMVATPAGLYAGTVVFALGMSLLYPSLITLTLTGVPDDERGSALGTTASFFDGAQGFGAAMLGGMAGLAGYRSAFAGGAVMALAGFVLLRSGIDPRTRAPHVPSGRALGPDTCQPDLP